MFTPSQQAQDYAYKPAPGGQAPRAAQSSMKGILAQQDSERSATPVQAGKKCVAHRESGAAPFAVYDKTTIDQQPSDGRGGSKLLQAKKRDVSGKVGGPVGEQEFDPNVYRQARINNNSNMANQKARAWGVGEVFPSQPGGDVQDPRDKAAAQAGGDYDDGYGYAPPAAAPPAAAAGARRGAAPSQRPF